MHEQVQRYPHGFIVVDFTYGPLGFLVDSTLWGGWTQPITILFQIALLWVLGLLSLLALKRWSDHWWVLPLAAIVVLFAPPAAQTLTVIAVAASTLIAVSSITVRLRYLLLAAALAGVSGLILLSAGAEAILCVLVVAVARVPRRTAVLQASAALAAASAASFVVFAAVTEQPSAFATWVNGSRAILSGYSAALSTSADIGSRAVVVAVAGGLLGLLVIVLTARQSWPIVVPLLTGALAIGREGFTRADNGHMLAVLPVVLALYVVALAIARGWLLRVTAIITVGLALVTVEKLRFDYRPAHLDAAFSAAFTAPNDTDRAQLRAKYSVPQVMIAAIGKAGVDVDPYVQNVAWAYGLRWEPVPVYARYAAYEPRLDERNASAVAGAGRPQFILSYANDQVDLQPDGALGGQRFAIDDRWQSAEAPAYRRAVVCNYVPTMASADWTLLSADRNRCGAPQRLSSQVLTPGVTVTVPSVTPGDMLVATFSGADSLENRIGALLLRPVHDTTIIVDGVPRRLVRATMGDGVPVVVPPSMAAYAASATTLTVQEALSVSWYEVPYDASGIAAAASQ